MIKRIEVWDGAELEKDRDRQQTSEKNYVWLKGGRERASERGREAGRSKWEGQKKKAGDVEKDETEDEIEYIHEREIER